MNQPLIDLRSDTLSQPSFAMREAMATAAVGDSFYDEDPTVNQLEKTVADLFGHESALFVPSGTMSNQIAVQLHCQPGEALICASDLHILRAESGALAALAGIQPVIAPVIKDFLPDQEQLNDLFVASDSIVSPPTRLLVAENTHLFSGGRIHPFEHLKILSAWCHEKKIAFHLDGARIWHAHVETQIPLTEFGRLFNSLSVCFSKGLGAPAGSCLIGSKKHIQRAKLLRKRMGGTMRQSGILAAGAQFALNHHLEKLKEDHLKAKTLARWLIKKYPHALIATPETNIVLMKFSEPALHIIDELQTRYNLKLSALNSRTLRAVCYRDISLETIESLAKN